MNGRSNDSRCRIWHVLMWTLGVPGALLLVITIAIAARYIPGKARLDRLQLDSKGRFNWDVGVVFEPIVPTGIRKLVGDKLCQPLDRMKEIHFRSVNDDDLIKRHGCFDTESITIESQYWNPITDPGLSELGELRLLKSLEIKYGQFTSKGLQALAKSPYLTILKFEDVELSPDWFDAIQQFRNLKQLEIYKNLDKVRNDLPEMTLREVEALAAHPKLRSVRLNLSMRNNEDGPLAPLDDSPDGCTWRIHVKELTKGFTEPLAQLRDLDTLVIHCDTMTPDSLIPLARMPSLRRLHICGEITEHHLDGLKGCIKLESLTIVSYDQSAEPKDHGLNHLADLPSLKELVLYLLFSPKDIDGLGQVTNLKALRIAFDYETISTGIERLKSLRNLEEFDMGEIIENGSDLDVILSMPKLRWLRFSTYATLPHHLQELAQRPELPAVLKDDFPKALLELEAQACDPVMKDHSITLSLGQRTLLPADWEQGPGID